MNSVRNRRHCARNLVGLAALVLAASASAASLEVDGEGSSLGGTAQGYRHVVDPAAPLDLATGSYSASESDGSFLGPGYHSLDMTTTATSSARLGQLSESSAVTSVGYGASVYAGAGGTVAQAFDIIQVHGNGPITLTLHTRLAGETDFSADANAGARVRQDVYVSPHGRTDNSEIVGEVDDYSGNLLFDHLQSGSITVADGEDFYLIGHLSESSGVDPLGGADLQGTRTNTAGTTSVLDYWISLSPGATLSSDSGCLYQAPAAVPEPAPLAALGIGAAAFFRRRRRSVNERDAGASLRASRR